MISLVELDSLEILDVIDGEVDTISANRQTSISVSGQAREIAQKARVTSDDRGGATFEFRMDKICCGAHGLSLLVTGVKDGERRTFLFDAGPEGDLWERNADRLEPDLASVELMHLSHWHRDHSGGLVRATEMISQARKLTGLPQVVADLHPDRPLYRGLDMGTPVSMEADPTFGELKTAGAAILKTDKEHNILNGYFVTSGEIPMITSYENGLARGMRFHEETRTWEKDEAIQDERFVMCNVKGKGLVLFTGCSHRGVINAAQHAIKLAGGSIPLYAIVGGYHLADATEDKVHQTVLDFKALDVKLLLAGHCTGWRAKFAIEKELPNRFCPCFVGTQMVI